MNIRILASLFILFSLIGTQGKMFANPHQQFGVEPSSPGSVNQAGQSDGAEGEQLTPYQEALMKAIEDRKAKGLPVPESVRFTYEESTNAPGLFSIMASSPGSQTKMITATTIIQYANPQQAGFESWPAIVVENNGLPSGAEGTIVEGDYTERVHQYIKDQIPLFDLLYTFGQEPRQKVVTEKITITDPEPQNLFASSLALDQTSTGKILMGKAYYGPEINVDKRVDWEWCFFGNCVDLIHARVFMKVERYSGLRLPGSVSITGPESVSLGSTGNFSASFHPEDWNAAQYTAAGVAPEDGYEDISRIQIQADTWVFIGVPDPCWQDNNLSDCPDPSINISLNDTKDLVTPLGPGASFYPAPQGWTPAPVDLGFVKIDMGIRLEPTLTSQKITADYTAVPGTDAVGSGKLTFVNADSPVSLSPIQACISNPTGTGKIRLSNFRYYFTDYKLKVSTWFLLDFDDLSSWGDNWETDVDLSWVFNNPLYGKSHGAFEECNQWLQCTPVSTSYQQVEFTFNTVDQDKPVTTISLTGTPGNHGWFRSEVTVKLDSSDSPEGCGGGVAKTEYSLDGGDHWLINIDSLSFTDEGKYEVSYRSIDKSGNIEDTLSQNIWIDKTPPVINGAPSSSPNANGWWKNNVVVHFVANDGLSGIDTVTPDITISTEGANQSRTGTAVDMAGNEATFTVSGINIDKIAPVVTITNPLAKTYANTDPLTVQWTSVDTVSGIEAESADLNGEPVSNGQSIDFRLLPPGDYTLTVYATDIAGNNTTSAVDFFVDVDINGLIASVDYMCQEGWINSVGICNGFLAELNASRRAIERGNCGTAENLINAFIQEVEVLSENFFTEEAATVTMANVQYVIENLSCTTSSP